ncbi:MAG: metallophosphoesterase [Desulfosporosinus sp.]|nr:metallophosphoesterase [Desulfosporosinus sp.]
MKTRQVITSVSVIVIVLAIINFYIGLHVWQLVHYWWPNVPINVFWSLFAVIVYAYLIGSIPWPKALRPLARFLKVIGSYYFAVMMFAVILLPIVDLVYLILRQIGVATTYYVSIAGETILTLMTVLLIWGSRNAWSTVVRSHSIQIEKNVADLSQLRIAVASDLHLGNIIGKRHLKRMVERINAMEPDLILLPGDVLDDSIEPFIRDRMSEMLKELKAKYGVFAVLGNHEYYGGAIEQYVGLMESIGIQVLQDEIREVDQAFYVVGRKDRTAESMDLEGRQSITALLAELDTSRPVIVIDHQPFGFDLAARYGVDLLLCGHTHRGQIAPGHWITKRLYELDWGYMRKEQMHVVVSSGYGTWGPPIRLASRSEIIELVVKLGEK